MSSERRAGCRLSFALFPSNACSSPRFPSAPESLGRTGPFGPRKLRPKSQTKSPRRSSGRSHHALAVPTRSSILQVSA